jgi:hypothetical protein
MTRIAKATNLHAGQAAQKIAKNVLTKAAQPVTLGVKEWSCCHRLAASAPLRLEAEQAEEVFPRCDEKTTFRLKEAMGV